jgi:cell division initiation protein
MQAEVRRVKEMEDLLRRTLISAEKNAADQKEAARRDAAQIVREAEQEAREILGEAHHQRAAVWRDTQGIEQKGRELQARYRAFLQTAEAVLDEIDNGDGLDEHTEERELFREEITLH